MPHEIPSSLSYVRLYVPTHRTLAETHLLSRWATESLRNCIFSTAGKEQGREEIPSPCPPLPLLSDRQRIWLSRGPLTHSFATVRQRNASFSFLPEKNCREVPLSTPAVLAKVLRLRLSRLTKKKNSSDFEKKVRGLNRAPPQGG
ncbi:hypothetical protein AVEN_142145-1 [Araneus ventricosus]|uniref:Uncharacterized protein n=1 Tax=Araneus ventricosus TaxID=182803 RepID=A0A4Y2DFC8_ARAVE|nr:hypothetical protein AVEN_142145-1 [Araneus ventricosus]